MPAIDVRQSYRGSDVVETLERVIGEIGCPKTIRLDNGPESSAGNSIYGPLCAASRSTSAGLASRVETTSRFARIARSATKCFTGRPATPVRRSRS
jgi:hypothetical protein